MSQKTYKLNLLRVLEFWAAPILIIAFITFLIYVYYEKDPQFEVGKLVAYLLLTLIFIGPFVWLFFNHLKNMEVTQLQFSDTGVCLCKNGNIVTISYEDILDVTEYSMNKYGNAKLPWSVIFKFRLKTENQEFIISSLIISKTNLKKFIKKDLLFEATYFPSL